MRKLLAAAGDLQEFLRSRGWQFCFIGGIAYQRWGRPRVTQDADVTLITGLGREVEFIEPILARYKPRRPDALQLAMRGRGLLVETENHIPFDIALGAFPLEERVVSRAT
ncbi:MAG: hypothetical protein IT348_13355, partial [Candidatus Eisenbacteria bacterium]|nr:hypothetical protein [Candidatus Eisenbacteria bacterium]